VIPYFEQPSFQIGPLTIHAFGVVVASALFLGLSIGAARFRRVGLDGGLGERMSWWAVIGGFLGAHLFALAFYHPEKVRENPLVLLQVWGDISSFGSILGGLIGILLFFGLRERGTGAALRLAYLDAVAYVFPVSLMVGRIGCALAHDHPGRVTTFPLAVSLATEQARDYIAQVYATAGRAGELPPAAALAQLGFHDLGLSELLYLAGVVVPVMLVLGRRPQRSGVFLAAFFLFYMPVRFGLDFLRVADVRYAGLTPAQWVALIALLAVVPLVSHVRAQPRPGRTPDLAEDGSVELDASLSSSPGQPADR
jgi:phosphatidylglycerol:prolipoprotein diacylglycerol transferase